MLEAYSTSCAAVVQRPSESTSFSVIQNPKIRISRESGPLMQCSLLQIKTTPGLPALLEVWYQYEHVNKLIGYVFRESHDWTGWSAVRTDFSDIGTRLYANAESAASAVGRNVLYGANY